MYPIQFDAHLHSINKVYVISDFFMVGDTKVTWYDVWRVTRLTVDTCGGTYRLCNHTNAGYAPTSIRL